MNRTSRLHALCIILFCMYLPLAACNGNGRSSVHSGPAVLPPAAPESSANRPPVLDPIGNKVINKGETLQFTVTGSDPDGDRLTYSASNLPAGASFDCATRRFTWTPDYGQTGNFAGIHFEVSDGEWIISEEILITIHSINPLPPLEVDIDIVPEDVNNKIDLKRMQHIPVAILSAPDFFAPSEVDRTTLTFGATGDEASLKSCQLRVKDVDGDGLNDLECTFNQKATGFQCGDTEGILKGKTVSGRSFEVRQAIITRCN